MLGDSVRRVRWHAGDDKPEPGGLIDVHIIGTRRSKGYQPRAPDTPSCQRLGINAIVDKTNRRPDTLWPVTQYVASGEAQDR